MMLNSVSAAAAAAVQYTHTRLCIAFSIISRKMYIGFFVRILLCTISHLRHTHKKIEYRAHKLRTYL